MSRFSEKNAQLIDEYDKVMVAQSLSKLTREKHLQVLWNLGQMISKDWKDFTKSDIDDLLVKIMTKYADSSGGETRSSFDHKKVLKIFFRWLKFGSRNFSEVGNPPEIQHIKMKRVKNKIIRENLITEEDRIKILHACGENLRDRAFIDCHLEAGTRPGVILNLQIRHVKFDEYGAMLYVYGKTGARSIRLIKSVPYLAAWLDAHPFKNDTQAPLWPNLSPNLYGRPISYASARQILRRIQKKANLPKRFYLNLFRHSEATDAANFLTEAQLRKRHGWTPGSKMPERYVHIINSDVDSALFAHYGIVQKEKENISIPKKCPVCDWKNSGDSTICVKCGKPMDLEGVMNKENDEKLRKDLQDENIKSLEEKVSKLTIGLEILKRAK